MSVGQKVGRGDRRWGGHSYKRRYGIREWCRAIIGFLRCMFMPGAPTHSLRRTRTPRRPLGQNTQCRVEWLRFGSCRGRSLDVLPLFLGLDGFNFFSARPSMPTLSSSLSFLFALERVVTPSRSLFFREACVCQRPASGLNHDSFIILSVNMGLYLLSNHM